MTRSAPGRYSQLLDDVTEFVASHGMEVNRKLRRPASDQQVAKARAKLSTPLPEELVELYQDLGNGGYYEWLPPGSDYSGGGFELWTLLGLVELCEDRKRYAVEFDPDYKFPYVKDPKLAKKTAARMRHWIAFIDEGDGDAVCLDTTTGRVVYNKHDWYDGGTGANHKILAPSLWDFFRGWAGVCFGPHSRAHLTKKAKVEYRRNFPPKPPRRRR